MGARKPVAESGAGFSCGRGIDGGKGRRRRTSGAEGAGRSDATGGGLGGFTGAQDTSALNPRPQRAG